MKKWNKENGSITLEACMVVPMFIMLMLLVNGLFVMFMGQQIMAHALMQSAKSMAFDPYSSQRVSANTDDALADMFVDLFSFAHGNYISTEQWYADDAGNLEEIAKERFIAYISASENKAIELLDVIGVKNGLSGLDFSECSVADGILTMKVNYVQEFIYNAFDFASFERTLCIKVKLFNYTPID